MVRPLTFLKLAILTLFHTLTVFDIKLKDFKRDKIILSFSACRVNARCDHTSGKLWLRGPTEPAPDS